MGSSTIFKGNKKMHTPVRIDIILEAETITRLNQIAEAVSKNSGLNISRGEIIRAVLVEYVRNSD